jgi:hypothetical protein
MNIAVASLVAVAVFSGSLSVSDVAWAKHKKSAQTGSTDPCAEPTAFVQDHIAKIRALQATMSSKTHPTVVSLFGSSSRSADQDTEIKISDLRHDADQVNELLRVGGCKTVNIDESLKTAAVATAPVPPVPRKKHHNG